MDEDHNAVAKSGERRMIQLKRFATSKAVFQKAPSIDPLNFGLRYINLFHVYKFMVS